MKPCARSLQIGSQDATKNITHLRSGLGDGSEVVDEVGLGHADTGVADAEELVLLLGGDADVELFLGLKDGGVSERLVADFVESIGTVGNQFTKEDLLVGVESVK